jgi:hypothetical protein
MEKQGKKYANMLAKALDSTGDSYALNILKENRAFDSYNVKRYRHRIVHLDYKYILGETKMDEEGGWLKGIFLKNP